jgi:hypothetical protein
MPEPSPTRSRRPSVLKVAVPVTALILVVGVAVWFQLTSRALAAIEVLPQSMRCGVHETPYVVLPDEMTDTAPFIGFDVTLRPRSFCQLEIFVVNNGSRTVHVDRAVFPGMGSGGSGSALLEITENGGRFTREGSGSDDDTGEAVFPIDESLDAGEGYTELFDLRTRAARFTGNRDLTQTTKDLPQVRISYLGRSRIVDGSVALRIRQKP